MVTGWTSSPDRHGARIWRAPDLGGVELFRASLTEFSFSPHAHEEFFIALTERGRAAAVYRGGTHMVGPGDVITLNPEEPHAGGPPAGAGWTYRALYADPALMSGIAADLGADGGGKPPRFGRDLVRDRDVTARLRHFHRLAETPVTEALQRETYLAETLVLLVGRHGEPPRGPRPAGREHDAVRLCMEYLRAHARENVTLQTLSGLTGLSPFHLCRVFGKAVGMTPHAYLTQARVRRAKALLKMGLPAGEVAVEAGFYDQAHLTRHFKRLVGLTPVRYARDAAV
ncbi:AraC family transcriptional regulator [Actinomadura sp. NBRC 104412]|uniref:AraC family transcriptional regulator n=1 Tax=Actinomadura sp. NBRC 104412 TaxID=3032203 RepID=UPI0024A4E71D|nr:AraC family transcriptional regulator [Actinomadura sp. NBRC 104412]GLZ08436.1 AraC family transcriptional regulator [Actinomadura sp. NBRC 104412]